MNYKNSHKCKKCPQSNTENGCPIWWEVIHTNIQSGEQKTIKACGYTLMPLFLTEFIRAANRPGAELEAIRKEMRKIMKPRSSYDTMLTGTVNSRETNGKNKDIA